MPKLKEIVYQMKNLISGGTQSDDVDISDRQLVFIINYYRAKLIRQDMDKGRSLNSNLAQSLGKVSLIESPKNECSEVLGCKVYRTTNQIPKPVELQLSNAYLYVGGNDGSSPFLQSNYNRIKYDRYSPYTAQLPRWYEVNGYIYIVAPERRGLVNMNIVAVFENPLEANRIRCTNLNESCDDELDFEYPISINMLDIINKMVIDSEFKILLGLPEDTTNNSQDKV